jgi:glucosamine--fructose-6-phosphate aminotransferase (isomerizing)
MCGIIGSVSQHDVTSTLLKGLYSLEYRGYDSAGIAINTGTSIEFRKVVGDIAELDKLLALNPIAGNYGIAHTRWATHGAPSIKNCHPISNGLVTIVHNGIIENYAHLKSELQMLGWEFETDTDTEVIAHLIAQNMKTMQPFAALSNAVKRLTGLYSFLMIAQELPGEIFGYKKGAPLLIGLADDAMFFASDAVAIAGVAKKMTYLEDGEIAVITANSFKVYNDQDNQLVDKKLQDVQINAAAGKDGFQHFMLKEINEQPKVLANILKSYLTEDDSLIKFPDCEWEFNQIQSVKIIACGSSYYTACAACYWFEELLEVTTYAEIASEFCYKPQKISNSCLYIFISQSGETADTLASLKRVKAEGGLTLALVNVEESSIARLAHSRILTLAGPEVSVASTKSCTAQLMVLSLLSLKVALKAGTIRVDEAKKRLNELRSISESVYSLLLIQDKLDTIVQAITSAIRVLYIGRGDTYPIALEGALKLREISYITAMGVAAGELKHGTIALVDQQTPIVVLAPYNSLFAKTVGSVQGVHARGGRVQLLTDKKGASEMAGIYDNCFIIPQVEHFASPILYSVVVQLIAYKAGVTIGLDVDKPRNLAKSVTVE